MHCEIASQGININERTDCVELRFQNVGLFNFFPILERSDRKNLI
jgi:hypothetical protein